MNPPGCNHTRKKEEINDPGSYIYILYLFNLSVRECLRVLPDWLLPPVLVSDDSLSLSPFLMLLLYAAVFFVF